MSPLGVFLVNKTVVAPDFRLGQKWQFPGWASSRVFSRLLEAQPKVCPFSSSNDFVNI